MTNVIIGTENPQKREAVREAFEIYFGSEINVEMINVSSDVPKQPLNSQIMEGAENRIRNLKHFIRDEEYDFLVSIEAGIMQIGLRYYNMQYVVVENAKTGKRSTGISQMIEIPQKYVNFAVKTSINNVFRMIFGNDLTDGITILTKGEIERRGLIKSGAVMALAGQVNSDIW